MASHPDPGSMEDLAAAVQRLSQRMDCFYSWATQLQHEIRTLQRAHAAAPQNPCEPRAATAEDPEQALLRRVGSLRT